MARMGATSRDPEEWSRATVAARATRECAARQVAAAIAEQVEAVIVEGDIMGGRALAATRVRQVAAAERRDDAVALRAAVVDAAAAFGQWAAALDYRPPSDIVSSARKQTDS